MSKGRRKQSCFNHNLMFVFTVRILDSNTKLLETSSIVTREIAGHIATELAPPVAPDDIDMAGCSARLFETVNAAFADLDARP